MEPLTATISGPRARVTELARVLGKTFEETVSLAFSEDAVVSPQDWVPWEATDRILADHQPRRDPKDLRPMIARVIRERVGRGDDAVPLPVLKNQLLDLTNRTFHESDYGWPNMRFLPAGFPDLLLLDDTNVHGSARILENAAAVVATVASEEQPGSVSTAIAERRHIRQDLWDAVIDYRSGSTYVWDTDSGRAVRSSNPGADERRTLPTVAADDVRTWRVECARDWLEVHAGSADADIQRWVEVPYQQVPGPLIRQWRAIQRNKVAGIIEQFFAAEGLPLPADAFPPNRDPERRGGSTAPMTPRQLLHAAADVMTDNEIEALELPLVVVVRALETAGGSTARRF